MSSELDFAMAYVEGRFAMTPQHRLKLSGSVPELTPQFILARTRLGCLWRFREDLAGDYEGLGLLAAFDQVSG